MGFYTRAYKDYDGEGTVFRVHVADLNAGNIAAQLGLQAALGAATNDMVLGALNRITYGNEVDTPVVHADEPTAQRELKWLVQYHDSITGAELGPLEIGTANPARLDPNARSQAQMGDAAEVDAFVDAFEAYVLSPAGNAVIVDRLVLVGRNT